MIKIAAAIVAVATLILAIGRRWFTLKAKKRKLLGEIRELEYEMCTHEVGSAEYNRLSDKWMRLNEQWGDITRNS